MRLVSLVVLLNIAICGIFIGGAAQAATLLQDIQKGIKRIDRQLCAQAHSSKCKTSTAKPKYIRKHKPVRNELITAPPKPEAPVPKKIIAKPNVRVPVPKEKPLNLRAVASLLPIAPPIVDKPVANSLPAAQVQPLPRHETVPLILPPERPVPDLPNACFAALVGAGTSFSPVPQIDNSPACQVDTPVRLNSLATALGVIKLPDQPILNCAFALKFSQFVGRKMQPLAQQSLSSPIVAMGTGPGFNCRGRNGDSGGKMSEHAIGNAVDIEYIKLANKSQIQVKDALNVQSPSFAFLRDLRASACTEFTTVLGPGANAAHAEHFHIDLEVRRGGYKLCE